MAGKTRCEEKSVVLRKLFAILLHRVEIHTKGCLLRMIITLTLTLTLTLTFQAA